MLRSLLLIIISLAGFNVSSQQRTRVQPIFIDGSFDEASKIKLDHAISLLDSIYNSDEFRKAVNEEKFKVGNYDLSAAEIFRLITSGMDNYKDAAKDYSIDLRLNLYDTYKGGEEFGNTNMNSRVTSTHRCYIQNNDVNCYASHLAHEYMHQIGFYDIRSWRGLRRTKTNSVPYKIGNIVSDLIHHKSTCLHQTGSCGK